MKRILAVTLMMFSILACSKKQPSTPAEQTYAMTGTIVSRDPAKNTLNIDNKEVPGKMMAMKMDYEVRDAKVTTLPPDGTAVTMTVHDNDGTYYITDVKPAAK